VFRNLLRMPPANFPWHAPVVVYEDLPWHRMEGRNNTDVTRRVSRKARPSQRVDQFSSMKYSTQEVSKKKRLRRNYRITVLRMANKVVWIVLLCFAYQSRKRFQSQGTNWEGKLDTDRKPKAVLNKEILTLTNISAVLLSHERAETSSSSFIHIIHTR
jgi:hypothetical protein